MVFILVLFNLLYEKIQFVLHRFFILIFSLSCKDELCDFDDPRNIQFRELCQNDFESIRVINGVLSFSDWNHFFKMYDCLNEINDIHNNFSQLADLYNNFDDDFLQQLEDSLSFIPDEPLLIFERNFNYTSLREFLFEEEINWLENEVINITNDPYIGFLEDDVLNTLLNARAEVIISNQTFVITDSLLNLKSTNCKGWKGSFKEGTYQINNKQRKYFMRTAIRMFPSRTVLKSKVRFYQKNGNKWKKLIKELIYNCMVLSD